MSLCFLPRCLDCCLDIIYSIAIVRIMWQPVISLARIPIWLLRQGIHTAWFFLSAACKQCTVAPRIFFTCILYFSLSLSAVHISLQMIKEHFLVMEYRDFCQLSPSIEIIILYGQRIFNCGTGSNNTKRCYLFSSLSLQQMGATFKAMPGFKM